MVTSDYLAKTPVGQTGGFFYLTQPQDKVYLLEFDSPPDNRLTTDFIDAFLFSLDIVEQKFPKGVLITTSKIPKFYSNGLDLDHVRKTPKFLENWLFPLFRRLLAYPMPTIALINGHCFAGGLIIAMYQDYRVMSASKGFLCMNEVLFGAVIDSPMIAIFRQKVTSPGTFRSLMLEGHRFAAKQALAEGLVDATGGLEEALFLIRERDLKKKGEAGVYRQLKEEMYRDTLWYLQNHQESVKWRERLEKEKAEANKKAAADMCQEIGTDDDLEFVLDFDNNKTNVFIDFVEDSEGLMQKVWRPSVVMPKTSQGKGRSTSSRKDPISKDPKASHLYTDDNPETTLKSTGFKDAKTAHHTISLIKDRSLTYRFQVINTMFHRASHHPSRNKDIDAAIEIYDSWLKETYPAEKKSLRDFKPILSKNVVAKFLNEIRTTGNIDTTFADVYVDLAPKKRLANSLMDPQRPDMPDLERARYDKLCELLPRSKDDQRKLHLWETTSRVSREHLELIAFAYSPVSESLLAKAKTE